ncbi:hypothetical protein FLK61_27195 [Paenalkalicoccus suaedae]|uniref:Uncharacterized protein n=1 Tax=Paenalkalicoccus suaedae TaxID=2592382 RepID=A0A859FCF6_9BACI|nr:hypothetical protein [Paenalkalicoccus suaedae]QKS70442.1 hypothetical protein FLK61_27195 [Paenalkalicoccus suaedae]
MLLILGSIFCAIIIFQTIYYLNKALKTARYKHEITVSKQKSLLTTFIVTGLLIALIMPFGIDKLLNYLY